MFGRLRRFLQRNFGKIVVGAVAVPLLMRLAGYAARQYLEYRSVRRHELLKKYKKQQLFEMMEETFSSTFKNWFNLMKDSIKEELNAEMYTELLKNDGNNKLANWSELKVLAFSRILSMVYGSAMLTVLLRTQVNVISGLLFRQMEEGQANPEEISPGEARLAADPGGGGDVTVTANSFKISEEVQQEYMILTRHLCTNGIKLLCRMMHEKSERAIGNLSLKQKLTVSDVQNLLAAICSKKLGEDEDEVLDDWCLITEAWRFMFSDEVRKSFIYPPESFGKKRALSEKHMFLRMLICEAFDVVNGEDARIIMKFLEAQGINHYLDRVGDFLETVRTESQNTPGASSQIPSEANFYTDRAPLAKLIPVMNSFIDIPFDEDTWTQLLLNNESLRSFSANIYESYSSKQLTNY